MAVRSALGRSAAAALPATLAGASHAGPRRAEMRMVFGDRSQLARLQQDARYDETPDKFVCPASPPSHAKDRR